MRQIDRRTCLGILGGGLLVPMSLRLAEARGGAGPLYIACHADPEGRHLVSGFEPNGRVGFDLPLPERGHAIALAQSRHEAVVFARRPGRFAVVIDYRQGVALRRIDAPPNRHFYGHGVFSSDDRTLLASENDYANGIGVIGIYDATDNYRRLGEYSSYGIGPHELVLMPDGDTLAIANGGIRTHPDQGRAKLNLDSMSPSLTFASLADGKHLDAAKLPRSWHRLSLRHLAVLANGDLVVAMQYEGSKRDRVPLVGIYDGQTIGIPEAPQGIYRRMRHYAGSVTVDRGGTLIAVSAPRGNLVTFWDGIERRFLMATDLIDGCGVARARDPGKFVLSSGNSQVVEIDARSGERKPIDLDALGAAQWDNHLQIAGF